jgi:hypothetical protein
LRGVALLHQLGVIAGVLLKVKGVVVVSHATPSTTAE